MTWAMSSPCCSANPDLTFGDAGGDGLGGEARATITFLGFELGQAPDVLTGLVGIVLRGDPHLGHQRFPQTRGLRYQRFEFGGVPLGSSG